MFFVGFDIFSIDISVNENSIKTFSEPLTLSFDISTVKTDKENLQVYYFDEWFEVWKKAGDGGKIVGNKLIVNIDHLTDFALMEAGTVTISKEIESQDKSTSNSDLQLAQILNDASIVFESGTKIDAILKHNNAIKDTEAQKHGMDVYTNLIIDGFDLTLNQAYAINNFIVYGTKSTKILGAGEKAGVVNSYKKAFAKIPTTQEEWADVVKIGNGRWPNERSETAENKANIEFMKIYKRPANMDHPNDNAAVTVIAYGLRPVDRNLNSEKVAIKTFKHIYKYNPKSALDWDITRAIAYSGATREVAETTKKLQQDVQIDDEVCKVDIKFSKYLFYGTVSNQVIELQKLLQCLGYFGQDKKITNFFGRLTGKAVKDFQKDNKIKATGTVGPFTRKILNEY